MEERKRRSQSAKRINEAYTILKDPVLRRRYDFQRNYYVQREKQKYEPKTTTQRKSQPQDPPKPDVGRNTGFSTRFLVVFLLGETIMGCWAVSNNLGFYIANANVKWLTEHALPYSVGLMLLWLMTIVEFRVVPFPKILIDALWAIGVGTLAFSGLTFLLRIPNFIPSPKWYSLVMVTIPTMAMGVWLGTRWHIYFRLIKWRQSPSK